MNELAGTLPHEDLHVLRRRLQYIHKTMADWEPLGLNNLPILDSSVVGESSEEIDWLQPQHVPGFRSLREAIQRDISALDKFLDDPHSAQLPALSTNAPYLLAVWNEVLLAPAPVISIFKVFPLNVGIGTRGKNKTAEIKVDVVADNGKRWIRVNTIKNSRILAEFREIDSYNTDSEGDSEAAERGPESAIAGAPKEVENSLIRMGRSLLAAAKQSVDTGGSDVPPQVTIRLTRLDPAADAQGDPRIAETLQRLRDMGVDVQLGERNITEIPSRTASPEPPRFLRPTTRINLDLSLLIALISDLTHAPLPASVEEAKLRFVPPRSYLEWKSERAELIAKEPKRAQMNMSAGEPTDWTPENLGMHTKQLVSQVRQEMGKGLLIHMREGLFSTASATIHDAPSSPPVEFWTTPEARDRCLRIVEKIGGPSEKRRVHALFPIPLNPVEDAVETFWRDSRYPQSFLPLPPIKVFPSPSPSPNGIENLADQTLDLTLSPFFQRLAQTCEEIIAQEIIPNPRAFPADIVDGHDQIQRATVTKANPRLTAHTVQSMWWGGVLGWTTLTANKTSVRAILREMRSAPARDGGLSCNSEAMPAGLFPEKAALWVVDPRSLSEGMRGDLEN